MDYKKYYSSFAVEMNNFKKKNRKIHDKIYAPLNGCFISVTEKLVYMHIDKCASTSISTALEERHFFDGKLFQNKEKLIEKTITDNYTFFAVIRDPYSRWVSGISEFMSRFNATENYVISQVMENKYIFDEHTLPQYCFLDICYKNKIDIQYIRLDNKLEEKINSLLKTDKIVLDRLRESDPLLKLKCQNIFEKYVKINLKEFDNLYKNDFVLYSKSV